LPGSGAPSIDSSGEVKASFFADGTSRRAGDDAGVPRSGLPVLVTSDSGVLAGCRGADGVGSDLVTTGVVAVSWESAPSGEAAGAANVMALAVLHGATSPPSPDPLPPCPLPTTSSLSSSSAEPAASSLALLSSFATPSALPTTVQLPGDASSSSPVPVGYRQIQKLCTTARCMEEGHNESESKGRLSSIVPVDSAPTIKGAVALVACAPTSATPPAYASSLPIVMWSLRPLPAGPSSAVPSAHSFSHVSSPATVAGET